MSELINQLTYLQETKNLIKTKLGLADSVPFRDYLDAMDSNVAPRIPKDWLTMPNIDNDEEVLYYMINIIEDTDNTITLSNTDIYNVDIYWGDRGVTTILPSEGFSSHTYDFSSITSPLTAEGYKQVIITITPTSGNHLENISAKISCKYFKMNAPLITTVPAKDYSVLYLASNNIDIESFGFTQTSPSIILRLDINSEFPSMPDFLIEIWELNAPNATSARRLFSSKRALGYVGKVNTPLVTDFSCMFSDCSAVVKEVNTSSGTNFNGMFYMNGESGWGPSKFPSIDVSNGVDFTQMFYGCAVLTEVPVLNTHNGTSFNGMFGECFSLRKVGGLDLTNAQSADGIFSSDTFNTIEFLQNTVGLDKIGVQIFGLMYCDKMKIIPPFFVDVINLMTDPLNLEFNSYGGAPNLIGLPNIKVSGVSVAWYPIIYSHVRDTGDALLSDYMYCPLSRDAILEIFNNLEDRTVDGQIVRTQPYLNIYATAGDMEILIEDVMIAVNKGWTVGCNATD